MVVVIALHVINARVCGGIHPFRHKVMGTSASLPVSIVTLVQSEYNQKGRCRNQDTDSVWVKDINFPFSIIRIDLQILIIKKEEANSNQSREKASINRRSMEFEDQIPSESGTIVVNHFAYCAEDLLFLYLIDSLNFVLSFMLAIGLVLSSFNLVRIRVGFGMRCNSVGENHMIGEMRYSKNFRKI